MRRPSFFSSVFYEATPNANPFCVPINRPTTKGWPGGKEDRTLPYRTHTHTETNPNDTNSTFFDPTHPLLLRQPAVLTVAQTRRILLHMAAASGANALVLVYKLGLFHHTVDGTTVVATRGVQPGSSKTALPCGNGRPAPRQLCGPERGRGTLHDNTT